MDLFKRLIKNVIFSLTIADVAGNCPVEAPQWGLVRERVLKDGSLQTVYSCETGRKLKGHKILTCTTDGWNHPIPACVPSGESLIVPQVIPNFSQCYDNSSIKNKTKQ